MDVRAILESYERLHDLVERSWVSRSGDASDEREAGHLLAQTVGAALDPPGWGGVFSEVRDQLVHGSEEAVEILKSPQIYAGYLLDEAALLSEEGLSGPATAGLMEWALQMRVPALRFAQSRARMNWTETDDDLRTRLETARSDAGLLGLGAEVRRDPSRVRAVAWVAGGMATWAVDVGHLPFGVASSYVGKKMIDRGFTWLGAAPAPRTPPG